MKSRIFHLNFSVGVLLIISTGAFAQNYNQIEWGTYFNDVPNHPTYTYTGDDYVDEIKVSPYGDNPIYIVGKSKASPSQKLITCASTKKLKLGGGDGFLAKYDNCGNLVWSTYIADYAYCMALDIEDGRKIIYVAGKSSTPNSLKSFYCDNSSKPVFQPSPADDSEGFIAKFADDDSVVTLLRWTYFGSTMSTGEASIDEILGITVFNHRIFAGGDTDSPYLINGAKNVGDDTYGGSGDCFMAEFDSLLTALVYFSYIGNEGNDRCHDLKIINYALDSFDLFISGTALSNTGIATGSGFDQTNNGGNDAFVQQWKGYLKKSGLTLNWGTYIGGSLEEHSRESAIDSHGNLFLTGYTSSSDFPATNFAYDKTYNSGTGNDAYLVKIGNNGSLLWATYFGSTKDEDVNGISIIENGSSASVAISGITKGKSSKFPLINPIQDKLNGDDTGTYYDAFIAILSDNESSQQQLLFSTYLGGSNEEGVKTGNYHPGITTGINNELFFAAPTLSSDIKSVVGKEFKTLVHEYTGASDAFIAKLIDSTNASQISCNMFTKNEFADSILAASTKFKATIFPNPSSQPSFFIDFNVTYSNAQPVSILVYNYLGKNVYQKQATENFDLRHLQVNLPIGTVEGYYLIKIIFNDQVIEKKLMYQK